MGEKILLTISRPADAATGARLFGRLNSDQEIVVCGAGEAADGVTTQRAVTTPGTAIGLEVSDFLTVTFGGVVTPGQEVMSGVGGKAVKWVPGNVKLGRYEGTSNTSDGSQGVIKFYRKGQETDGLDVLSADGAVAIPSASKTFVITKATAAALTIVDPTADTHDGVELTFISATAAAHTLSNAAGSGFNAGGAGSDVGTFGGAKGDGITIVAYQGDWYVKSKTNVTLA